MSDKVFILYDGRALYGADTDDCAVLCSANTERQAQHVSKLFRNVSGLWFEYDVTDDSAMSNERPRPDIGKGILLGK